jgi:short-subunit dehydrogenase
VDLTGATALVTGANRGIGLALTRRLVREPVRLVLAGVRDVTKFDPPAPTATATPAEIRPVRMDLSTRADIDACCDALGDELVRIDLLINNAGLVTGGLLEEQDMAQVYAMFQVNLVAVAHLTHRVLPGMLERRRGTIVNNASISGYAHFPAATTYAASKAGVVALTQSLRRELEGTGVRAMHLITPGVQTDMLDKTQDIYSRHLDISGWGKISPEQWADEAITAVKQDRRLLKPHGRERLALRATYGPHWLLDGATRRAFSRTPRR